VDGTNPALPRQAPGPLAEAPRPTAPPKFCRREWDAKRMRYAAMRETGAERELSEEGDDMAERVIRATEETGQESLGDLVALAVSDISQLIRYEVDLAKLEIKADLRKLLFGAALVGFAAFACCLVLMLLCFGYAFGLAAAGAWGGLYAAFFWAALTFAILAVLAALVGKTIFRRLSGLPKTRGTVSGDLAMIRRDDGESAGGPARAR